MGISTSLVFGIPLTGAFGEEIHDVDPAVWDYAFVDHDVDDDDENFSDPYDQYQPGVVHLSTAEDMSLAIGIELEGEYPCSDPGLDLGNAEQVKALHDNYLAVIAALPEEVKQGLERMGRAPKLFVLRGHS